MYQYYRKDRLKNSVFLSLSVCTNGLFYSGEETRPKLCLKGRQANSGASSLGTNKQQLLHRIQSVQTFTNLQKYRYKGVD